MEKSNGITLYNDIRTSHVRWLWYPFIAAGKITLLQGDPGDGKSTMMMNMISEISNGNCVTDGKTFGIPKRVIYQCSEDDASDTIKPRLEACGANCKNIAFINEDFDNVLTLDDDRVKQAIIDFRPVLLVIDPVQAYLGNDSDLLVAGRLRKLLRRLALLASTYECAIILVGHLNKKEGGKCLYRSLGSIDLVAAARSVLQIERDKVDPHIRIVRQIKNSLAPNDSSFRFEIRPEIGFRWLGVVNPLPVNDVYEEIPMSAKRERAALRLKEILADSDMQATVALNTLEDEGLRKSTVEYTKRILGIRSYRKDSKWYWSLHPWEDTEEPII